MADQVWAKVDELAKALTETEEYRKLAAARKEVEEREAARIMLRDLQQIQEEIAAKQAAGEPVTEEMTSRWQQRLQLVGFNPYVREYLEAEMNFAALLMAVQARLAEALGLPGVPVADVGGAGEAPSPEPPRERIHRPSRLWTPS